MGATKHMHIVSRGYLRCFADPGDTVDCHFTDGRSSRALSTVSVGVRRNFYAYHRADGSRSIEPETMMRPLESAAVPVIRQAPHQWPLTIQDRATLAEFLGLQIVRTPAWRTYYVSLLDKALADQQAEGHGLEDHEWQGFQTGMRRDARRFLAMFRLVPKIGSLIASMHWTLLRFGSDRLITSDHPVVPIELDPRTDVFDSIPRGGVANVAEFRFPLSPRAALLTCWADEPEDVELRGSPSHAREINHFVKKQAEIQWFSRPGTRPSHMFGDGRPLTYGLIPGCGPESMSLSLRRRDLVATVNRWIDTQEDVREIHTVTVKRHREALRSWIP